MLNTAFGKSNMSKTRIYEWYKCFQDGCEDIEDDECTSHPSTSTIIDENMKKVEEMIMKDRRITIDKLLMMLAYEWARAMIFFHLFRSMKCFAAKFVPKALNFEQKRR